MAKTDLAPEDGRKQRRQEAEDRRLDVLDALMHEAHVVTFQADMIAHRLTYGLADLDEARQFIADTDTSENPFIDLSFLEHTAWMVKTAQRASQLDLGSGAPARARG